MKLDSRIAVIVAAFLLIVTTLGFGQTASISGTVTDPTGAVVPGAIVTATNRGSGALRTETTSGNGEFSFVQLAPGTYVVKAEKQGFKAVALADMDVLVNTNPRVSIKFSEVGSVSETVVVSTEAVALNTTDATLGNAFNSLQVRDLPLSARNVVGLLSLQPGVTTGGNVNGGRFDQANITLDGVDVNDQDQRGSDARSAQAFFSVLRMTPDSLSEFRVTTTNPNAEQGRSSGAQISLITKSGTNQYHGSLYEYNRVTATTANDWFNNKAGVARPALIRNNFGGAIGGPIKRDKLFFFFNYEGFRQASGTSVVRTVPLPSLGQGILRYKSADGSSDPTCPAGTPSGTTCQTSAQISAAYRAANGVDPGINPAAVALFASASSKYQANDTTVGDLLNTAGYRYNASTPVKQNTSIFKMDYNLSQKHVLSVRANYQQDNSISQPDFPDTPQPKVWDHPVGLAASDTWTVNSKIVNSLRYGITRDAISTAGDSSATSVVFRNIFSPYSYSRTATRTTPVHNFIDNLTWNKGTHNLQFGANIRLISNTRNSFSASYDSETTNPSFYAASGAVLYKANNGTGANIFANQATSFNASVRDAVGALIGREAQYTDSLVYGSNGQLQPSGTGVLRTFKTQEYEFYAQDSWRVKTNLTLNYGLNWSTSTPVYEAQGFEVTPTTPLSTFFGNRVASMNAGTPYNNPISIDYGGPSYGKPGFYPQSYHNFGPAASIAYQPVFTDGILGKLIGNRKTTIRAGYRLTYDHIGSALAIAFDLNNTLGFTSSQTISANTYNVTTNLGPEYTGLTQNVRVLPGLTYANQITFPLQQPSDGQRRIESSLDYGITTPYNHGINLTIGRDLGKGYTMEVSYVARFARNLLVTRDVAQPNDIRDPANGVDWYSAMGQLMVLRNNLTPITSVAPIPYFEDMFKGAIGAVTVGGQKLTATQVFYRRVARTQVGGLGEYDYTTTQDYSDSHGYGTYANEFFQPQYGALSAFSTVGYSNYNSLQVSLRKQLSSNFTFDFNYTWGHSIDIASGAQNSTTYGGAFIVNAFNPGDERADSNFDIRHIFNVNYLYTLPFGHGQRWLTGANPVVNGILGGWRTTGIFRYSTGLPSGQPFDTGVWATNWEISSSSVQLAPIQSTPTRTGDPNLFSNPTGAYENYRNAYPGEVGDRNVLRLPGLVNFDFGLYKEFSLSKLREGSKLTARWEVFNLTNTQPFGGISSLAVSQDPYPGGSTTAGVPPPTAFGKFTSIQGSPRVMQFALRVDF